MKDKGLLSNWINSLKEDFPEYAKSIEKLDLNIELVEDYYICKEHLKMLQNSQKSELLQEFSQALEALKVEIHNALLNERRD